MNFNLYHNIHDFSEDVFGILQKNEAKNNLILGNLAIGVKGENKEGWRDPTNWVMATVSDENNEIALIGLMTPPYGMTFFSVDETINDEILACFANGLIEANIELPGIVTEKVLGLAFAKFYCKKTNGEFEVTMNQRIYELTGVNPNIPKLGRVRPVDEKDLSFLPYWIEDFKIYAGHLGSRVTSDLESYRHYLRGDKHLILEDNKTAVSMAGAYRETTTGICIGMVYSPPYFRGKGYASSVVAHLSQSMLDLGYKACYLYTDLANPTSNSIYQKIGYIPVCDSVEIQFKVAATV